MEVFVVTHGSYSDTRVVAVCDTEDKARLVAETHTDHKVIPCEVNDLVDLILAGYRRWVVVFNADGNPINNDYYARQDNSSDVACPPEAYPHPNGDVTTHVTARDKAEAIKIGSERRAIALSLKVK